MSVDANIDSSTDLLGKVVADLQSNITVGTSSITGVLKYVTGYTGYSGITAEQSGNFLALHAEVPNVTGVTINVHCNKTSTLDADGIFISRIADKNSQMITVVASKPNCVSVSKTFTLSGLTLQSE